MPTRGPDAGSNLVSGNGTNVATFTLPGSPQYAVQSVVATVDNSAGGDTGAVLTMADTNGAVIAKKRQGETIPGGDTGTTTWALRLDDKATTSSGYTPPTENEVFQAAGVVVNNTGIKQMPWTHVAGANLVNLSNPAKPKIVTAGIYAVNVTMFCESGTVAGQTMRVGLALDQATPPFAGDTNVAGWWPLDPDPFSPNNRPAGFASQTWYLPANAVITAEVAQRTAGALSFEFDAWIQRVT